VLCKARLHVKSIQCVNCATYGLPRDKWDVNLNVAAPKDVNSNTTHMGVPRRGVKGHEITAKCSEIDGAGGVYHPKIREITSRGCDLSQQNMVPTSVSLYSSVHSISEGPAPGASPSVSD
jgi:hypothetical protein